MARERGPFSEPLSPDIRGIATRLSSQVGGVRFTISAGSSCNQWFGRLGTFCACDSDREDVADALSHHGSKGSGVAAFRRTARQRVLRPASPPLRSLPLSR